MSFLNLQQAAPIQPIIKNRFEINFCNKNLSQLDLYYNRINN